MTLTHNNSCVARQNHGHNEVCTITVDRAATITECPSFDLEANYDFVTIDGVQYSGSECPEGVELTLDSVIESGRLRPPRSSTSDDVTRSSF